MCVQRVVLCIVLLCVVLVSVIVKASNGPRYVVGCRRQVSQRILCVLRHTYIIMIIHQNILIVFYRSLPLSLPLPPVSL